MPCNNHRLLFCVAAIVAAGLASPTSAFSPSVRPAVSTTARSSPFPTLAVRPSRASFQLASTPEEQDGSASSEEDTTRRSGRTESATALIEDVASSVVGGETTSYPIDLPSPVLLGSAVVLAIAFVGSLFELAGGNAPLGFIPTAVICLIALPSFIFLFYAAVQKGAAETEEDDAEYNSPSNRW